MPVPSSGAAVGAAVLAKTRSERDVRLDFVRGLSMFIIFVAHVPANSWFLFIPARFGFSSAAELFVFCSGLASGYAFGRTFLKQGFATGSRRVLRRVGQVYGAHFGLVAGLAMASYAGLWLTGVDYPGKLALDQVLARGGDGLVDLAALRWMPAYGDILPLYIVLLAMIPLVMALARISTHLLFATLAGLWLIANLGRVNFPANGTEWFFNPLAWQLLFFAGFSFGTGWLKAPGLSKGWLFWLCGAFVLISIPLNFWAILDAFPALNQLRDSLLPPGNQTYLSPLRFGHFLALAYCGLVLIEPHRALLGRAQPIVKVGQQSLPTFVTSTILIWVAGMALDWTGRDAISTALINLAGFGVIISVAYAAAAFKGRPRQPTMPRPTGAPGLPLQVAE